MSIEMSEQWMVFWALTAAVAVSWLVIYYLYGRKNKEDKNGRRKTTE